MPRLPVDYNNTVIYKIVCNDLSIKDLYVGHTTDFRTRKNQHKTMCNRSNEKYNYKVYQVIRNNGGWDNWSMIEIEKFQCNDSNEATARERYWIEQLKASLNSCIPHRTKGEWHAEYYEKNKEHLRNYCKDYFEKNKERLYEKVDCECGLKFMFMKKVRHLNSNRHKRLLNELSQKTG